MSKRTMTFAPLLRLSAVSAAEESAVSPKKPNIVYILTDDLGYGDVQVLNPQCRKFKTPNYDRLAAQAMTFTDSHSAARRSARRRATVRSPGDMRGARVYRAPCSKAASRRSSPRTGSRCRRS